MLDHLSQQPLRRKQLADEQREQQWLAEQRECSVCPPGTLRCVHYGEQWLCLHVIEYRSGEIMYSLCQDAGRPQDWSTGSTLHKSGANHLPPDLGLRFGNDLPAALAAFEQAEQQLLQEASDG